MANTPQNVRDAITCYILSRQQGTEMIAQLMGKSVSEVKELIAEGKRFVEARQDRPE